MANGRTDRVNTTVRSDSSQIKLINSSMEWTIRNFVGGILTKFTNVGDLVLCNSEVKVVTYQKSYRLIKGLCTCIIFNLPYRMPTGRPHISKCGKFLIGTTKMVQHIDFDVVCEQNSWQTRVNFQFLNLLKQEILEFLSKEFY